MQSPFLLGVSVQVSEDSAAVQGTNFINIVGDEAGVDERYGDFLAGVDDLASRSRGAQGHAALGQDCQIVIVGGVFMELVESVFDVELLQFCGDLELGDGPVGVAPIQVPLDCI